jgi:hypothetical protein
VAVLDVDLNYTAEVGSQVLEVDSYCLRCPIELKSSDPDIAPLERLLLIQVDNVGEQEAYVQPVISPRPTQSAQNVEPRRQRVSGGLVEDAIRTTWRNPKAHRRELDVDPARVQRGIYYFSGLSHLKAANLENHGEGKERAVLQLKAGTRFLLVFGDRRAD